MKNFFTEKPFQASVIPGISTQGQMSGQVVSNFSFNLFGGYTAGVKGLEIAGLFNMNKKDVRYLQAAGLFNIVGGSVTGLQVGGLQNTSLKNVTGFQVAGINNFVKGNTEGVQIAGIGNIGGGTMHAFQLAGIFNYQNKNSRGLQLSGIGNIGGGEVRGLQAAAIFNYAKKLKGIQFAVINITDTSEGYSIGLVNVVLKGYHKLAIYATEVTNANAAFKTGSPNFYSILQAGANAGKEGEKVYTFGYGLGTEIDIAKWVSVNPELGSQYVYLGSWDYLNLLNKLHLQLNIKFSKRFSIFGGPSFTVYYSEQEAALDGYKYNLLPPSYHSFSLGNEKLRGWPRGGLRDRPSGATIHRCVSSIRIDAVSNGPSSDEQVHQQGRRPRRGRLAEHGLLRDDGQASDLERDPPARARCHRAAHLPAQRGRPGAGEPAHERDRARRPVPRRRGTAGSAAVHRDDRELGAGARPRRAARHGGRGLRRSHAASPAARSATRSC